MLNLLIPYRFKKWSTLLGGVLIHLSIGSYYTFGNMSPYLTSYLREYKNFDIRYSQSVWIFTTMGLSQSIGTIISGLLHTIFKFNIRINILFGCLLMSSGIALTHFTINYSFLMTLLTYGLMSGLGIGFAYLGPLSIAMKWFPENRGLANSAILFGYGGSSIIFDQIQTRYINPDNYSPDKPYSSKYPDEKYFSQQHLDLLLRVPKSLLLLGAIYLVLQMLGFCLICDYYSNKEDEQDEQNLNLNNNETERERLNENEMNSLGVKYLSTNDGMSLVDSIKKPVFSVLTLILATSTIAPSFVVTYYKTFGLTFINNDNFLATVGSVSSIFNASGRLFWGYLVDRFPFKICILILDTCLISLCCTIYLTKFIDIDFVYLIWVSAVLFCQCGIFVLMPTATAKCFGQKNFTAVYGLMFLFGMPSSFIVALLGTHSDQIGWFWLFMIGSLLSLIGWSLGIVFNVKKSNGDDI